MASLLGMSPSHVDTGSRQSAFVLSNPPLAALHSMTEMKVPQSSGILTQPSPYQAAEAFKTMAAGLGSTAGVGLPGSTPHGINDILGRPIASFMPRGLPGITPATAAANMYLNSRFPKPLGELGGGGRPPLYWTAGMLGGPAWRQGESSVQSGPTKMSL